MSNGFETIKQLGAQKICETTHISRQNIDAILNKKFDAVNKIQFAGFISIIEREFAVDLSDLKAEYDAYHNVEEPVEAVPEPSEPAPDRKEKREIPKSVIAAAALIIVIAVALITGGDETPTVPAATEEKAVIAEAVEVPETAEENNLSSPEVKTAVEEALPGPLAIIPKSKLWMGFINLENYKKEQTVTSEKYELDARKEWLMVFGHGFLKIENGDEISDFRDENKLRFLYEAGTLREISKEEFVRRNRGENW